MAKRSKPARRSVRLVEVDEPRGRPPLSRAATLDALRELARRGLNQSHDVRDARLRASMLSHFGTFRRARAAAGLPTYVPPIKWTRERLATELRRLHRDGERITATRLHEIGRGDLLHAAHALVGSLGAARRIARIPEPPPLPRRRPTRWDQLEVIAEIEARLERGESLARSRIPGYLAEAARRHCGSWAEAIEMAGLDYGSTRLTRAPRTKDEIIDDLRALARARPRASPVEINRTSVVLAAKLRFGSLAAACEAAEIHDWPVRRLQEIMAKADTIEAIQARHARRKAMTAAAVAADDPNLREAGVRHFGSWERALRAARVSVVRLTTRNRSDEDALDALRAHARAGKPMSSTALRREDPALSTYLSRYLGGFLAAVHRAGVAIAPVPRDRLNRERRPRKPLLDKDTTLKMLRERLASGRTIARHPLRNEAPDLFRSARHHFGTWPRVRAALGLRNYHARLWSEAAALAALRKRYQAGKPITTSALRGEQPDLLVAVQRYLGGLRVARKRAGIAASTVDSQRARSPL